LKSLSQAELVHAVVQQKHSFEDKQHGNENDDDEGKNKETDNKSDGIDTFGLTNVTISNSKTPRLVC
jgi:hypothetical protein